MRRPSNNHLAFKSSRANEHIKISTERLHTVPVENHCSCGGEKLRKVVFFFSSYGYAGSSSVSSFGTKWPVIISVDCVYIER